VALVVAAAAAQKAKGKVRPHAMVRKKLADDAELMNSKFGCQKLVASACTNRFASVSCRDRSS
jgi:hypothetical protein